MILEQHYLGCLAQASYLIGDERTREAAIVDPRRDVDEYLEVLQRNGLELKWVLLTHLHADFVAGHLELAQRTGCGIALAQSAGAEFEHRGLSEGDAIALGDVRIEVVETPGHTPEGLTYLVYGPGDDPGAPHAALTGDTLFVGDVGRPDLAASTGTTADELAGQLYDSLFGKLLKLPDKTLVYPGHGAGSMCGKNLSSDTWSTMGEQRRSNAALQVADRAAFIARATTGLPLAPAYFAYDARQNKSDRAVLEEVKSSALKPLDVAALQIAVDGGAKVLDTRPGAAFAAGHWPGSIHVALDGKFASWVGTMVPPGVELVVIAEPGREEEAVTRLGRIGYDQVRGFLQGGGEALAAAGVPLSSFPRVSATELKGLVDAAAAPALIDIRTPGEWEGGHIDGAEHRLAGEPFIEAIPDLKGRDVILVCGSGYRSTIAASLLLAAGAKSVSDLEGGMQAWNELD